MKELKQRLSVSCPQLVEWHGYGEKPKDYYSLRNTFSYLWTYIKSGHRPSDLTITARAECFCIIDLAESMNRETMEQFLQVMIDLTTDVGVQKRMKRISAGKRSIELTLRMFQQYLKDIADDTKRKHKQLEGSCPTCKPWLEKLVTS